MQFYCSAVHSEQQQQPRCRVVGDGDGCIWQLEADARLFASGAAGSHVPPLPSMSLSTLSSHVTPLPYLAILIGGLQRSVKRRRRTRKSAVLTLTTPHQRLPTFSNSAPRTTSNSCRSVIRSLARALQRLHYHHAVSSSHTSPPMLHATTSPESVPAPLRAWRE